MINFFIKNRIILNKDLFTWVNQFSDNKSLILD